MRRCLPRLIALALALSTPLATADGDDAGRRDAWDAVFIDGQKVGHIHYSVTPVTAADGRELVRVQVESTLNLKRLDDTVVISTRYGTIETVDGQVLRLDSRSLVGPNETRIFGDAKDEVMPLTLVAGGQRRQLNVPWPEDVRGPYGPEMSLTRMPMAPGQTREVKTFIPDLNQVGLTSLTAREPEEVELGGDAKVRLMPVDSEVRGPDGKPLPGMDATFWVDSGGQILKSRTDAFKGIVTYRTTEQGALAPGRGSFDIVKASIVPVGRRLTNPEATRAASYRVDYTGEGTAAEVFPSDARQQVRGGSDGAPILEVRSVGPADSSIGGDAETGPEDLAANPMLNSEDARVVALTRRAIASSGDDPWARASAITLWVADNLVEKNFQTAFATASDVARDLSGDCSEHSVLTAAMCRAAGIPARVVVGLLYVDELGGFGFHMWDEVYINGRWVAVDAALRQTEVDATHLKLNSTDLDGVSPYAQFLDVVRVFDKLRLDPVSVR